MTFLLIPALFVSVAGLAGYLFWHTYKRRREAWGAFAWHYGLMLSDSGLHLQGQYERRAIRIATETRGHGKHRYTVTVLHVSLDGALPRSFSLEQEGLGDKLLKLFGRTDEEIGDAEFDAAFDLKNVTPDVRALLRSASVREHLHRLARDYRRLVIRDGTVQVEQRGVPSTVEALESFARPAFEAAAVLSDAARRAHSLRGTA